MIFPEGPLDVGKVNFITPIKGGQKESDDTPDHSPKVLTAAWQTRYSCLQLSWGLVADIERESEKFRWMGPARIPFSAVFEVSLQFFPRVLCLTACLLTLAVGAGEALCSPQLYSLGSWYAY